MLFFPDLANTSWKLPVESLNWHSNQWFKIVFKSGNHEFYSKVYCFYNLPWRSYQPSNLWVGHKVKQAKIFTKNIISLNCIIISTNFSINLWFCGCFVSQYIGGQQVLSKMFWPVIIKPHEIHKQMIHHLKALI